MRKSFFFSVLALAAVVSCTKSEVVDTKFNEAIGFETYLGRDAQTKATALENATLQSVKVFGYYGGNLAWAEGGKSLLWENGLVLGVKDNSIPNQPTGTDIRYWTNDSDKYTFLAYAPVGDPSLLEGTDFDKTDPKLTYTVDPTNFTNADVLVAEPQVNRTRDKNGTTTDLDGNVPLVFKHRLARLTVKATATSTAFDFRIKEVTLSGNFYNEGKISLIDPTAWETENATETSYSFFDYDKDNDVALDETKTNVIGTKGYLMMIPVTAAKHAATLTVKYTTYDSVANQESREYEIKYNVENDFNIGSAYAINLNFSNDAKPIQFTVTVDPAWAEGEATINPVN